MEAEERFVMNKGCYPAWVFLWLILLAGSAVGRSLFKDDKPFVSPDGHFVAKLDEQDAEDGDYQFTITDRKTGKVAAEIPMGTFLLGLKWLPDSQAFVAVVHLAGGSGLIVVRRLAGHWVDQQIEIPGKAYEDHGLLAEEVVFFKIEARSIHCVYRVKAKVENGDIVYYRCEFEVDPRTGAASDARGQRLTDEQDKSLKTEFPQK